MIDADMTELRRDRVRLSKPLPRSLLKTFEAYLPHVLGVTDPEHAPLVKQATERFDAYVQSIPPHEVARDQLFMLLSVTLVQGTFLGLGVPPWRQSTRAKQRVLKRLFRSDGKLLDWVLDRIERVLPVTARDLAKSLREMMSLAFYSNPNADEISGYTRVWDRDWAHRPDVVGVEKLKQPAVFDPVEVAAVHYAGHPYDASRLFADDGRPKVAIIGSGAGGAVMAAKLAETKRFDVAVFESGPWIRPGRYPLDTFVGMSQLFESGLLTLSENLDIHLLRGRLVGGGTVMTSGLSVRLRPETLDAWCSTSGELSIGIDRARLDQAFDEVRRRQAMGTIREDLYTDVSHLLGIGASKLGGWQFDRDDASNNVQMHVGQSGPRRDQNGDYCIGCGLCNYGCHFGHKLSMDLTYIPDAVDAGARIHQNLPVQRLEGRMRGGQMHVSHIVVGRESEHRVKVDHVVVSAGAVGSPALLLRSAEHDGTWNSLDAFRGHVGTGLGFNYGSAAMARWQSKFAKPGHMGFQIKYVATKHGDPTYEVDLPTGGKLKTRYVLENAFVPPGLISNVVPGVGAGHLQWMRDYEKLAMCASTIGSPQTGTITADRVVKYKLNASEMDLNRRALASIARLYFAAGAEEVGFAGVRESPESDRYTPLGQGMCLKANATGSSGKRFGDMSEDELIAELKPVLADPEHIMLSSAHPQGGLRMSKAPHGGAVDPDFRLRGASNVSIVDGSVFPSTIVVNPQWTIAALALVAAQRVARDIS